MADNDTTEIKPLSMGEAASNVGDFLKARAAPYLGIFGDVERYALAPGVDYVGKLLGYNPQLSQHPVYPSTRDIQRQWGLPVRGSLKGTAADILGFPGDVERVLWMAAQDRESFSDRMINNKFVLPNSPALRQQWNIPQRQDIRLDSIYHPVRWTTDQPAVQLVPVDYQPEFID
jgi:hypothetical protein